MRHGAWSIGQFLFLVLVPVFSFGQVADPVQYVNPFIGTDRMGHTYPGATVPFGMVQLSPDTDTIPYEVEGKYNKDVYKYCAGYQYEDKTIVGFSHTHFSGTGHSDLGDILLIPATGPLQLNPGTADAPGKGYRSAFSHDTEKATPGYYAVTLEDNDIRAEMTATKRVGVHRYTFNEGGDAHVILDMMHGIYNYDGEPRKTQYRVRHIMDAMYHPAPDGLGGNDDCGQMSAWYIFSALGFYPVAPGSDIYDLGSPLVKEAVLNLENGKTFTVATVNQSAKNIYVRKVELNGRKLDRRWITQEEIMNSGILVFYME